MDISYKKCSRMKWLKSWRVQRIFNKTEVVQWSKFLLVVNLPWNQQLRSLACEVNHQKHFDQTDVFSSDVNPMHLDLQSTLCRLYSQFLLMESPQSALVHVLPPLMLCVLSYLGISLLHLLSGHRCSLKLWCNCTEEGQFQHQCSQRCSGRSVRHQHQSEHCHKPQHLIV